MVFRLQPVEMHMWKKKHDALGIYLHDDVASSAPHLDITLDKTITKKINSSWLQH